MISSYTGAYSPFQKPCSGWLPSPGASASPSAVPPAYLVAIWGWVHADDAQPVRVLCGLVCRAVGKVGPARRERNKDTEQRLQ
jgi:hypothetical protein